MLQKIQSYFNNISKDFYCSGDLKVFQLFFYDKSIRNQQDSSYEKVLSKAATYSRKYLNSIFARKQLHTFSNPRGINLIENYRYVGEFTESFAKFHKIIEINQNQIYTVDDIFSELNEMCYSEEQKFVTTAYTSSYVSHSEVKQLDVSFY